MGLPCLSPIVCGPSPEPLLGLSVGHRAGLADCLRLFPHLSEDEKASEGLRELGLLGDKKSLFVGRSVEKLFL